MAPAVLDARNLSVYSAGMKPRFGAYYYQHKTDIGCIYHQLESYMAVKENAQEVLSIVQSRRTMYKKSLTLKLDERTLLYLHDLNASPTKTIDYFLNRFLTDAGVDVTKPHPSETFLRHPDGTAITYQEHWDQTGTGPAAGATA